MNEEEHIFIERDVLNNGWEAQTTDEQENKKEYETPRKSRRIKKENKLETKIRYLENELKIKDDIISKQSEHLKEFSKIDPITTRAKEYSGAFQKIVGGIITTIVLTVGASLLILSPSQLSEKTISTINKTEICDNNNCENKISSPTNIYLKSEISGKQKASLIITRGTKLVLEEELEVTGKAHQWDVAYPRPKQGYIKGKYVATWRVDDKITQKSFTIL